MSPPRITKQQLARLRDGGVVEPKKPKAKQKTFQQQEAARDRKRGAHRCPQGCPVGDPLFHAYVEAGKAWAAHRDSCGKSRSAGV